ncbi:MAG TPA: UDP-2,3-diacylglucosamine diphosphatase LpxI [Candidatus Binatus sp.]|nr:UDP-2,3-diacylglucosamine diphosphatase LpxI [Candidatus Binatus sp.]
MAERIGLIAGSGRFPVLFAETARRRGVEVIAVAHRGETDPELERVVVGITWVYPGELDTIITALKQAGVRSTVMVGGIAKPRLFRELRPDARAIAMFARCGQLRDDIVLRAVAAELEGEGIAVVASTLYLQEIVPTAGVLGSRAPTAAEWEDIRFGFRAAKLIGQFDIGQSVVVRSGAVIAVEGIEGTDATIRRAGQLGNGDIVLVKVCKPTQDTRFDLPAVGPATIRTLAEVRGRALAVEAGRTITLDRSEMIALADANDIAVVAVDLAVPPGAPRS